MSETLPFGLSKVDGALADALRAGLDDVEVALLKAVTSEYPFVTETSSHLVTAGGKRFRPLLALVAAQYGDRHASGNVPGAVVAELTHLATLYHDDVMDEALLRRGAPSANARWDNTVAILTGDFLFARAADIAADLGTDIVRLQARTFERLCTGQIRETVGPAVDQDRRRIPRRVPVGRPADVAQGACVWCAVGEARSAARHPFERLGGTRRQDARHQARTADSGRSAPGQAALGGTLGADVFRGRRWHSRRATHRF